ncbi:hypothetical protein DH2020_010913 [Rehmannia glutinosa]|uniref:SET domain-containing protein n=1 Tax=Rehmannia glutinosa TaxID=99300 RepID=A0ABR0XC29_REHGL
MPCLDNLLNLPASALADLTSCPEFKPILRETQFDPKIKPVLVRHPDPDGFGLGPQSTESSDDDKKDEFRGNGGGGGAIGKSPELESDPEKEFGSLVQPKLRSEACDEDGDGIVRALNPCRVVGPTTAKLVQEWSKRKIEEGIPEFKCSLPFLVGAPKSVQCGVCQNVVYPEEKIFCSVRGCRESFFKIINVIHFPDRPGEAICWKHHTDWRMEKVYLFFVHQHFPRSLLTAEVLCTILQVTGYPVSCIGCALSAFNLCSTNISTNPIGSQGAPPASTLVAAGIRVALLGRERYREIPANNLEDIFALLPLPYNEEEFKIDINWKDQTETKLEPHPYIPIKRILLNALMVVYAGFSASAAQKLVVAPKPAQIDPFRNNTVYGAYQTEHCGWGVVAGESISKGDFIVEYVGEVINDAMCERRLWDMKDQDAKNFYMCEINKDFVIDATFKGNASRFLNHSCAPNCKLEKWQVEGEIRVGVFASRSIEVGEALTYDYRYLELEGDINRRAS